MLVLRFSNHSSFPTSFSSFPYFPLGSSRTATVVATFRRDSRRFPAALDLFFIRKPCKHLSTLWIFGFLDFEIKCLFEVRVLDILKFLECEYFNIGIKVLNLSILRINWIF